MDSRVNNLRKLNASLSPLLRLPAELRNAVYVTALSDDYEIKIKLKGIHRTTTLLRASHQIRQEASPVFYGGNKFVILHDTKIEEEVLRFLRHKQLFIRQPLASVTLYQYTPSVAVELYSKPEEHYRNGSILRNSIRSALDSIAREMKVADGGDLEPLLENTRSIATNSLRSVVTMLVEAGVDKAKIEYQGMIRIIEDDTSSGFFRRQETEWVTGLGESFMRDV